MCSECLLLLEECPDLVAVQEMNQSIEVGLTVDARTIFIFLHIFIENFGNEAPYLR